MEGHTVVEKYSKSLILQHYEQSEQFYFCRLFAYDFCPFLSSEDNVE